MHRECKKVKRLISDYIDGNLAAREHKSVSDHITLCPDCRQAVDDTRRLVTRLASLSGNKVGSDLWPTVALRISAQKESPGFRGRTHPVLRWKVLALPAAAIAAGLIFVAVKPVDSPVQKTRPAVQQQVSAEYKAYIQAYSRFRCAQPLTDRGAIGAAEQLNHREAVPN